MKYFTEDALTISAGQFVPKWDSPNCEGELATARTASLLVELERVGCAKVDATGNSKRPWVILNMAIMSPRIRRCVKENRKLFEGCFIWDMAKPFHEL